MNIETLNPTTDKWETWKPSDAAPTLSNEANQLLNSGNHLPDVKTDSQNLTKQGLLPDLQLSDSPKVDSSNGSPKNPRALPPS